MLLERKQSLEILNKRMCKKIKLVNNDIDFFNMYGMFFFCCFLCCNLLQLTKVEGLLLLFLYIHTCVIVNKCIQTLNKSIATRFAATRYILHYSCHNTNFDITNIDTCVLLHTYVTTYGTYSFKALQFPLFFFNPNSEITQKYMQYCVNHNNK